MKKIMLALGIVGLFAICACAPVASQPSSVATAQDTTPIPEITASDISVPFESGHVFVTAISSSIQVYDAPGVSTQELVLRQEDFIYGDTALTFAVISRVGDWLEVILPILPNGSTGWISTNDVWTDSTSFSMMADLSDMVLVLYQGDKEIDQFPIGIGKPSTRTPTGEFYVFQKHAVIPSDGYYGPYEFVLSAHSEDLIVFNRFGAWIGIHGTNDPLTIGKKASNGCIHLSNSDITKLFEYYDIPVGTPIEIRQ